MAVNRRTSRTRYPLIKIEYRELIDKKTDMKKVHVMIFMKFMKMASWSLEFEDEGSFTMDEVFGYVDVLKNKSNFFRRDFLEKFVMFSVSDIVFTDPVYDPETKTIEGQLVNDQLADFFNIEKSQEFNLVKKLLSGNIRFYESGEQVMFGKYRYVDGNCFIDKQ